MARLAIRTGAAAMNCGSCTDAGRPCRWTVQGRAIIHHSQAFVVAHLCPLNTRCVP